jgi:Lrp/AsnC family transcriptional regulator, leucine-responsive regulatory protein
MAMPEVIECMILFGEWDYVLTVVARDVDDYQRFVFSSFRAFVGVGNGRMMMWSSSVLVA